MIPKHRTTLLIAVSLMALVLCPCAGKTSRAEEQGESTECINCHTDLEEMDEYGAQAASSAAAVAG